MIADANNRHGNSPTQNVLSLLHRHAPPHTIIHIGAGAGTGGMHQWQQWDVPNAYIIDASADRLNWAKTLTASHPGWHVLNATLAETDGETEFYQATNPDEDSLIPPDRLNAIWPNLQTTAHAPRTTRRLDHLLAEAGGIVPAPWVFIDCLPALPILKSVGTYLDHCSVLWLRTLLKPIAEVDDGATLDAIEAFLQPLGFRCAEITESNHPAIGYALFVRDWRATLQSQIDTLTQALSQEHDRHARHATERQQQIETLSRANTMLADEKSALAAQRNTLEKDLATLTQARDEHAQLAAERQNQIESIVQERDRYAQLATERQQQIETLSQANTVLADEKLALATRRVTLEKHLATLIQARDEQIKISTQCKTELDQLQAQLKQKDARITQLEADAAELDARQRLLNDEMTRAEAQIDLIKDVLLREPGL